MAVSYHSIKKLEIAFDKKENNIHVQLVINTQIGSTGNQDYELLNISSYCNFQSASIASIAGNLSVFSVSPFSHPILGNSNRILTTSKRFIFNFASLSNLKFTTVIQQIFPPGFFTFLNIFAQITLYTSVKSIWMARTSKENIYQNGLATFPCFTESI